MDTDETARNKMFKWIEEYVNKLFDEKRRTADLQYKIKRAMLWIDTDPQRAKEILDEK